MSYTKVNLKRDVQDSATRFDLSPNLEARFPSDDLDMEQGGVGYEKLAPNFRVPFGHTHGDQEEVYVVVSGSGRLKLDDEIVDFEQWDVIRVGPGVWRNFESGPEGCEVIAFGAPKIEDVQAGSELDFGWWTD